MNKKIFIIVASIFAIFFLAAQACNFGGLSTGLAADCVGSGDIVCDGTSAYECSLASYGAGYTVMRAKSFDTVNCGAVKADCGATTALGTVGEAISFDGSASTGASSYSWDFDGDGAEDSVYAAATYSYSAEKKYTAALTVADSSGNTDSCKVKVTVKSSKDTDGDGMPDSWEETYTGVPVTSGPTAVCSASPATVEIGDIISFAGSGADDGTIVSYVWDLGNGETESVSLVLYDYAAAGSYTATLTVTDNDGNTDSCSIDITVTEAPVSLKADCGGPYVGALYHEVLFDGSASSGDIASYLWDFDDASSGTGTSTEMSPSHIYTKNPYSAHPISLTVTGTDGTTDTCTTSVDIEPCLDTDGGFYYTTKGTAEGPWYLTGKEGTWTDSCTPDGRLQEYSCNPDTVYTTTKDCSTIGTGYICSDGACGLH